jgi:hypothetical protein
MYIGGRYGVSDGFHVLLHLGMRCTFWDISLSFVRGTCVSFVWTCLIIALEELIFDSWFEEIFIWYGFLFILGVLLGDIKGKVVPVINEVLHHEGITCLIKHHIIKMYWVSGGIAPHILNHGSRWKRVVNFMFQPL